MALPVPYGFTFSPKDHELIYLLLRKSNGNSLPIDEGLIEERDLFGKEEPWDIFGPSTEKTRYFFAKLKKKGKRAGGSNFVRTAGKGTWKGQDGQIPIKDLQGRIIGFKKNLLYKAKGPNTHGRWLMKEYHLHGVSLQPPPKLNDYILCRIRKKDEKKKQNYETIIHEVVRFEMDANSSCQRIGENQDVNCAENSIIGRKRSRVPTMKSNIPPMIDTEREGDQHINEAEFWRDLTPILEKLSNEGFGGRLWTECEVEQMGDPQDPLQDWIEDWVEDWLQMP